MNEVVRRTKDHVRSILEGESTGHDWWHVYRVWQNAVHVGKEEKVDMFVVELAALLHDITDWKFHGGDEKAGSKATGEWSACAAFEHFSCDCQSQPEARAPFNTYRKIEFLLQ